MFRGVTVTPGAVTWEVSRSAGPAASLTIEVYRRDVPGRAMSDDLSRYSRLDTPSDDELTAGFEAGAEEPLTLAQAAKAFGTTPRALRFYEAKGLLSPR